MKKLHRSNASVAALSPPERKIGLIQRWVRFWFSPVDPIALHILRIAFGIFFIASLLPFAGYVNELLGLQGWVDQRAYRELAKLPDGPPISWSIYYVCGSSTLLLSLVY